MYCKTCGKEYPAGTTECTTCGSNVNEGTMYCAQCGHFCLPGDSQCVNCGCDLTQNISLKKTIINEPAPEIVVPPIPEVEKITPPPVPEPIVPPTPTPTASAENQFKVSNETPQKDATKKYCRNCGLIIDVQSLRCPFCDAEENSASKYCPNCGMLTTPQDKSCAYCGTTFGKPVNLNYDNPPQPQPAPQPQPQPQSNNYQQQNQQYQQTQPGYTAPPYIQAQPPAYNNQNYNRYQQRNIPTSTSQCSWLVTLLLCLFVGYLGVHRFYTKNWLVGIIQLFTGGGCGIWWLIDLILIVAGSYRDGDGQPLAKDV